MIENEIYDIPTIIDSNGRNTSNNSIALILLCKRVVLVTSKRSLCKVQCGRNRKVIEIDRYRALYMSVTEEVVKLYGAHIWNPFL